LKFPITDAWQGPAPVDVPGFPQRLSETGAFADTAALAPVAGIVPYEVQAPLWSDGAAKRRWLSVPVDTTLGYGPSGHLGFPPGTVLVKHFEMALDERIPEQRRRLETRLWVVVSDTAQYGVTYKWNADQTDADLLRASETEELSIVGLDGATRSQRYVYPGSADCKVCHNEQAGFVLGTRLAQLNRPAVYELDRPAYEQLLAWSDWEMLDTPLDAGSVALAPRLAALADESASLEDRVRSYWDGNCSMCHSGADGPVRGWDARFSTPLEQQGVFEAPSNSLLGAARLITPGSPLESLIYLRGDTTAFALRMPPIGRNRVDTAYVQLLSRWITSLAPMP
jgi:uncharacterized repeat protein (TIGR03806 family)